MRISEDTFVVWSKGPAATETTKCENAENAVRKAIKASSDLQNLDIKVFAQGSYKSRTNIRQDSDVDICVCCYESFFGDYPKETTRENFGHTSASLKYSDYKNMVEAALKSYFGKEGVTRGNKAFDVHANSYRIDADVVPTFEHRRYTGNTKPDGTDHYLSGVGLKPDKGDLIKNWPTHQYNNGVSKNTDTGRKYKRVIRILKRLRKKMQDDNISEASDIASFLIECLVWNADVDALKRDTYTAVVRHVIADLYNRTRKDDDCIEWGEVNELKYLFRTSQPWTRQQANSFLHAAWNYIGYK
jgi:hypothetical protein